MRVLTSIAPKHANEGVQLQAVKSWQRLGEVYSFNHPTEIAELETLYGEHVKFIPTYNTHEVKFGKPYVGVAALVDYAKANEGFYAIINSDCVLSQEADLSFIIESMKHGFCYLHRWDFDQDEKQSKQYRLGIDGFFFHSSVAKNLPQTSYCLGHCYFDIAYPYLAHLVGYDLYCEDRFPVLLHKTHNAQYKTEDWEYFGRYTALLIGKVMRPQDISQMLYGHLNMNTRYASKYIHKVLSQ